MSAQVFLSPGGGEPIPYAINVGNDGRPLQDVLNGACMLSGADFPEIGRVEVNSLKAIDWTVTIKDGDEIKILPNKTQKMEQINKLKDTIKEVEKEALKEPKDEKSKATEKVIVKTVRAKVDLSPVQAKLSELDPHVECLANDLSVLEDRLKNLTDTLSGIRKVISAMKLHTSQFETVTEKTKKDVQNIETRSNNPLGG